MFTDKYTGLACHVTWISLAARGYYTPMHVQYKGALSLKIILKMTPTTLHPAH